jgi:hypothetical protein
VDRSLQLSFDYRLLDFVHLCVARSGLAGLDLLRSFLPLGQSYNAPQLTLCFSENLDPGGAASPGLASILASTLLLELHPS